MNRTEYYNYIEERLSLLSQRIERRGRLNILDFHIHSENFYRDFFNLLYGWKLENANIAQQNVEAIDLIDRNNKILIQVSATNTKAKIENSFNKLPAQIYNDYTFKFISIAKSAKNLQIAAYTPPCGITFRSTEDIYDVDRILITVQYLGIDKLKAVYDFVWKELGKETPTRQLESALTAIIKLLSQTKLDEFESSPLHAFDVDRKIEFNQLSNYRTLIVEYNIYQSTVSRIYTAFDEMGQNKSLIVLNKIRKIYTTNKNNETGDKLFALITDSIKTEIRQSANLDINMSTDAIDMYVDMIVVDAFIRCKIFENPQKENNHATT
jgi:hypothetical protein